MSGKKKKTDWWSPTSYSWAIFELLSKWEKKILTIITYMSINDKVLPLTVKLYDSLCQKILQCSKVVLEWKYKKQTAPTFLTTQWNTCLKLCSRPIHSIYTLSPIEVMILCLHSLASQNMLSSEIGPNLSFLITFV